MNRARIAIAVAMCAAQIGVASAQTEEQLLYQTQEVFIERDFNAAVEKATANSKNSENLADSIRGIQWMLYNKANIYVTCMMDAGKMFPRSKLSGLELGKPCIDARMSDMTTFIDLAEYGAALDPATTAVCQMKARLFEQERLLRPYAFLEGGAHMGLFDFGALNQCLRERSALSGNMTA